MTLREKQSEFARFAAYLIMEAENLGYEVTLGWAYRPPEFAAAYAKMKSGIPSSLHIDRLAIDLQLFKDGHYLTDSAAYAPLGEWWKTQHELARWGGDFTDAKGQPKPDGNHFSFEHEGRK